MTSKNHEFLVTFFSKVFIVMLFRFNYMQISINWDSTGEVKTIIDGRIVLNRRNVYQWKNIKSLN